MVGRTHTFVAVSAAARGVGNGLVTRVMLAPARVASRRLREPCRTVCLRRNWAAYTCDMAPTVGLSDATVSHHLKQLLLAGLVTRRREGINVHYRLVPEPIAALARRPKTRAAAEPARVREAPAAGRSSPLVRLTGACADRLTSLC